MTVEGAIGIAAAIAAGSVALLGFGLDSAIEGLASVIVIWRFTGRRRPSHQAEDRAQKPVAISFFLLAPYIAEDAVRALIAGERPLTSWIGIGLAISSIVVMPLLRRAKQTIGAQLGSAANPAVALGIAALALHEGRETWRGEGCCAPAPISGSTPSTAVTRTAAVEPSRRSDLMSTAASIMPHLVLAFTRLAGSARTVSETPSDHSRKA